MSGDCEDLEGWLSCRNCELRNALELGDRATVARVGPLVAQGSAKMATFVPDVPMDGRAKSSLMSALIDQAEAKRRCIDTTQTDGSQVSQSRYGLRGVRVGKASHPGPQGRRIRDSSEEVLDGLERELNLIASDDELLVQPIFTRNVVPRINSTEPATVQRIERVLKVDRDSSDDVCGGGVRSADDRVSTPPSEVVDALERDLPQVFAMPDAGQTAPQ